PTQHSVREMREIGIQPDILICRSDRPIAHGLKEKIALFSNVAVDSVISAVDVSCIYELPLVLHAEGLDGQIAERLNIWSRQPDLTNWIRVVERFKKPSKGSVRIGVVGKYVHLKDSYKSLNEALVHAGLANDVAVHLEYIDSEQIERGSAPALLSGLDAILVPGGFGDRGVEGKISAIRYAREQGVPFFGICLGMQLAAIEFARNVCGLKGSTSTEFLKDCPNPIIDLMPDQRGVMDKGGTMRLGAYPCALKAGSHAHDLYKKDEISERHRHRFEFNNEYREQLTRAGLVLSGTSPDDRLVEIIELPEHPYFVGCQFHPEFKSRPMSAHPLFQGFVAAAAQRRDEIAASARTEASQTESTPTVN
ncbi:MAG TPA: CTP synthase, partial [Polyangiaceae bacterium]